MFGKNKELTCIDGGPHKFEPRFDVEAPPLDLLKEMIDDICARASIQMKREQTKQINALCSRRYICDVCVYCGHTVDRVVP